MAFNPQEFQQHMDKLEGKSKAEQTQICEQLKQDFLNMTVDERREAFAQMVEHNQNHNTKLTINGDLKTTNFTVQATTNQKILGGFLPSTDQKAESQ